MNHIENFAEIPKTLRDSSDKNVFRDVRDSSIPPDIMEYLGFEIGQTDVSKYFVVGGDTRRDTAILLNSLMKGLTKAGVKVIDLGPNLTTPSVEFLGYYFGAPSIMISASHLPPQENGLKMRVEKNLKINKNELDELKHENGIYNARGGIGFKIYLSSLEHTVAEEGISELKGKKVVIDPMFGAGCFLPEFLTNIEGLQVYSINDGIDPDFRGLYNGPDPTLIPNLESLIKTTEADHTPGFILDGDADRFFVVENGKVIDPTILALIFATYSKTNGKRANKYVFEFKMKFVEDYLKQVGIEPIAVKTGRPNMIDEIIKQTASGLYVVLGGELSGHYYDAKARDDGIKNILKILGISQREGKNISQLASEISQRLPFYTPEIRFEYDSTEANTIFDQLKRKGEGSGQLVESAEGIMLTNNTAVLFLRKSTHTNDITAVFWGDDRKEADYFTYSSLAAFGGFRDELWGIYGKRMEERDKYFL